MTKVELEDPNSSPNLNKVSHEDEEDRFLKELE